MDEARARLMNCFAAVFPGLPAAEIPTATPLTVAAWDSIANVTLLAVVEEEFGITVDADDLERLTSFEAMLEYLVGAAPAARS
jgi:acyl carrier protein